MRHILPLYLTVLLVGIAGCEDGGVTIVEEDLDGTLREALLTGAGGEGLTHFTMPVAGDLAGIPQDPRNPLTEAKVELGKVLFHETALARNPVQQGAVGTYSCSSCHHAAAGFQAAVPQGLGEGGVGFGRYGERRRLAPGYISADADIQPIRSPSAINGAWQEAHLWNGQFGATGVNAGTEALWTPDTPIANNALGYEGLETQAIAALTVHRMQDGPKHVVETIPEYRALFDAAFGDWPAETRVGVETAGLAIAAYERTLLANEAPFQRWLRGDSDAMTQAQKRGAIVFFGKGDCTTCHTGPSLASMSFHALGMGELEGPGVVSDFNRDDPVHLGRGSFTKRTEDAYTFKTPQLYNLADHVFFGHGVTFNSIREVVEYKNAAVPQSRIVPADRISPHFRPLELTGDEIDDLTTFLERGLYDPDLARYLPTRLPSGFCFPNNDEESRRDLGCVGENAVPSAIAPLGIATGFAR